MSLPDKIAVTGITGQIGPALVELLGSKAIPLSRNELDLSKPESIQATLEKLKPNIIINPAAYTAVDKAESEPDVANIINGDAVREIAKYAKQNNIPLIHYSTDYVFDGSGEKPWVETDKTNPLSAYGKSKLLGEQAIESIGGKYLILRTSWVYNETGKNFFNTMLKLGAEREELRIVADQFGAPSYAGMLAEYTVKALEAALNIKEFPSGVYHFVPTGITNWHGFASAIFENARKKNYPLKIQKVDAIKTEEYPLPAKRPLNSRLDISKFENTFNLKLPDWKDGLQKCFNTKLTASTNNSKDASKCA